MSPVGSLGLSFCLRHFPLYSTTDGQWIAMAAVASKPRVCLIPSLHHASVIGVQFLFGCPPVSPPFSLMSCPWLVVANTLQKSEQSMTTARMILVDRMCFTMLHYASSPFMILHHHHHHHHRHQNQNDDHHHHQ